MPPTQTQTPEPLLEAPHRAEELPAGHEIVSDSPVAHFGRNEPLEGQNEPNTASPNRLKMLLGLAFLVISVLSGLGLLIAEIPTFLTTPVAQTAAAAVFEPDFFNNVEVQAKSAYVFDVFRDKEFFAKNATAQLPLASITKVALVLTVAEVLPLDSKIIISKAAVARGGGGLTWGEEWKVKDLIDYTLITSSNTGAEALAEAADPLLAAKYPDATQKNATVWRMNSLAQNLGMHETYFINPTGLDESTTQAGAMSSARDVAKLFEYALRTNKSLFSGTTESDLLLAPSNFPERDAHNTNNALADIQGIIMGKTGTTDLAGGNLAIAFDASENHPVVVVVLGSTPEKRFEDVRKLVATARKQIAETR